MIAPAFRSALALCIPGSADFKVADSEAAAFMAAASPRHRPGFYEPGYYDDYASDYPF
jgi:hypothetical protein